MSKLAVAATVAILVLALSAGPALACPSGWGTYSSTWGDVSSGHWSFEYIRVVASPAVAWQSGESFWVAWPPHMQGWRFHYHPASTLEHGHWRGGVKRAFALSLPCASGGSITRASAASELIRAAGLGWVADQMTLAQAQAILSQFPDHAATPSGLYRDVAVAVWYGLMRGDDVPHVGLRLNPNNSLTREQGAALLARAALARVSTDRTSYFRTEAIQASGLARAVDPIVSETLRLHRDDHAQLASASGRSHAFAASGLPPGRYYAVYEFVTERSERILRWAPGWGFWWETVITRRTWRSAPAVFSVVNRLPAVTLLAPQGDQTDPQPLVRLRVHDADGDAARQLQVQVATDPGFGSLLWSANPHVTLSSGGEWTGHPSPLPLDQTLHVRARAWDGLDWGAWSAHSFAIRPPVPPTVQWLAPSGGSRVFYEGSLEVTFSGTVQTGAQFAQYELQAAVNPGFSPTLAHRLAPYSGGTARVTLTGLPGGNLWLRVRLQDSRGLWSPWGSVSLTLVEAVSPGAVPPPAWPGDGTDLGDPQSARERTRLTR
ncbi:MAG TPA: hypothetical protein DEQ28_01985 [Clostridiales bacterium]|nr:hypothetical protein [Clostridiales bacterium]